MTTPPPISDAARELAEKIRVIHAEGRMGTPWPGNGLVEVECQHILDAAKAEAVAEQAARIEKLEGLMEDARGMCDSLMAPEIHNLIGPNAYAYAFKAKCHTDGGENG